MRLLIRFIVVRESTYFRKGMIIILNHTYLFTLIANKYVEIDWQNVELFDRRPPQTCRNIGTCRGPENNICIIRSILGKRTSQSKENNINLNILTNVYRSN